MKEESDSRRAEHLSGYQQRDREVVDYRMYELPGTGLQFRGPPLLIDAPGSYFTCIGAAQTFGCFCERPFPALLAERLGLPALNLGYGGAGPEFFDRHRSLLTYINRSKFVVIQVMSGRSQSNSVFDCRGLEYGIRRSDGVAIGADALYSQLLGGPTANTGLPALVRKAVARSMSLPRTLRVIAETRRAWIQSSERLLAGITVPTILFWFSKRAPAYRTGVRNLEALFGEFPQLVNQVMVDLVRSRCDDYVECISARGSPQRLYSRFTGRPVTVDPADDRPDLAVGRAWTHNRYYPSAEMHEDAADALEPTCRRALEQSRR